MFFGNGFRIGRIAGVNIGIDYSWFIIFGLFVVMLATGFPRIPGIEGYPAAYYWLSAVITSLLFFASVLGHEMSHTIVARRSGIPINSITLFLFGGVAQMEDEPHTPWDEFKMAIAGPIASLVLGAVFFALSMLAQGAPLWAVSLFYLGFINVALAVFNMLPGFPMDGGRVFRALIWHVTGSLRKATRVASITGQAFGWVFIAVGIGGIFIPSLRAFGSIWMALIGWFLISAARNSYKQLVIREELNRVPVSVLMSSQVETISAGMSIERLVMDYVLRDGATVYPVAQDNEVVGTVSVEDIRNVPREKWAGTIVGEIMRPITTEATVHSTDPAWDAANRMAQQNSDRVLVEDGGHVDGIITRNAITRWLQTHTRLAPGEA